MGGSGLFGLKVFWKGLDQRLHAYAMVPGKLPIFFLICCRVFHGVHTHKVSNEFSC